MKKKQWKVAVADFETTTEKVWTDKSEVYIWGFKTYTDYESKFHWDIVNSEMEDQFSLENFFDKLVENEVDKCFFHNLSFDGYFMLWWLQEHNVLYMDVENRDELEENTWNWMCTDQWSIYSMNVNWKGTMIHFTCSYKLLMSSVEDLGKALGEEKKKIDYDAYSLFTSREQVPPVLIEYLERDIDVVWKVLEKVRKTEENEDGYVLKMTRSSTAYQDFVDFYNGPKKKKKDKDDKEFSPMPNFTRDFGGFAYDKFTKKYKWHNVLTTEQHDIIRESYAGGWVNFNKKYHNQIIECPNGVSYDNNSMFPAQMINHKMPYGKMLDVKPSGDSAEMINVIIKKAKLKNMDHPALLKDLSSKGMGYSLVAKYLDELNEATPYVLWREEFDYMLKYYDMEYEIIHQWWFKTKYVFKEWLLKKAHLKQFAPNDVEKGFHKGVFNGMYGKMAESYEKIGIILEDDENMEDMVSTHFGTYVAKKVTRKSSQLKHIAVASYITMKARLCLWDTIFPNYDIWLYSDTDSGYYTEEPKHIEYHPTILGKWKPEVKFTKFKSVRAKCYMYEGTHEFKALNKKEEPDPEKWIWAWKETPTIIKDEVPEEDENGNLILVKKMVKIKDTSTEKVISGLSNNKDYVNWSNFGLGLVVPLGKRAVKKVYRGKLIKDIDYTITDSI